MNTSCANTDGGVIVLRVQGKELAEKPPQENPARKTDKKSLRRDLEILPRA